MRKRRGSGVDINHSSEIPNVGLYSTSGFYIPGSSASIGSRTMQCWKQDKYQDETFKVHSNLEHSDIDHFNFLLAGSAIDVLSSLSLSATNYTEAVAVLKKCFGSKQQVVNKYMDLLLQLDAVEST
ncbi:hypothetical protein EMCRGX_G004242 [Ephydatia muelleri]